MAEGKERNLPPYKPKNLPLEPVLYSFRGDHQMDYIFVVLFTTLINLPFGYLRGDKKRFTFLWFLYIHIPVPFVILFREKMTVELTWGFAPAYFGAYLLGQWLGKKYFRFRKERVR